MHCLKHSDRLSRCWRPGQACTLRIVRSSDEFKELVGRIEMTCRAVPLSLLFSSESSFLGSVAAAPYLVLFFTLGILFAVGLKILHTSDHGVPAYLVSIVVCVLTLRTRISPLWFMAIAGLLGGVGLINRSGASPRQASPSCKASHPTSQAIRQAKPSGKPSH